jgi:hypothetical protein
MTTYAEYFLKTSSAVVQLETLEISHPNFTTTYRIVRNSRASITVTLEDSSSATFNYYPVQITSLGARTDLDAGFTIDIGDLGEILPTELDAIATANAFNIKPTCKYRTFRSDDLSAPLFGPLNLEITQFAFSKEGATFEAKPPTINTTKTGEVYDLIRFPMLRGFL